MAWHPFRNFGLKVVALFLGTLLWFTVSGQHAELTVVGVPVVYRNRPANFELTEQTEVVDIHVRGLDSVLRGALPRDFEARVDLADARVGPQNFVLRTDQVKGPPGVEVTQVTPGSVSATLELSGSKNVEVFPAVDGSPAPGFVVSGILSVPGSVEILGPARRVAATTTATTDRVAIDGARESVTQSVSVGVLDSALRLKQSTDARVTVTIEPSGERPFAAVRVAVKNLPAGTRATVEPNVVLVTVRGPQSMLARLDVRSIGPYVDVKGLGAGRYEVPVLFDLGGRLTIARVQPATVTVIIN